MMSPLLAASSISKRFSPSTHPSATALSQLLVPDDHVEAVVLEVQGLSRSLNAISENRDGLIREALAGFVQGPLVSSDHVFQLVAKLNLCHVSCAFVCSRRRSRAFCRT